MGAIFKKKCLWPKSALIYTQANHGNALGTLRTCEHVSNQVTACSKYAFVSANGNLLEQHHIFRERWIRRGNLPTSWRYAPKQQNMGVVLGKWFTNWLTSLSLGLCLCLWGCYLPSQADGKVEKLVVRITSCSLEKTGPRAAAVILKDMGSPRGCVHGDTQGSQDEITKVVR